MNSVRGFYYFIYWNIFLLTSFRRVDGFPSEEIAERIQLLNEENNTAQRTDEFTWFYETDYQKTATRLPLAFSSLSRKVRTYLRAVRLTGEPSLVEMITEVKNFLWAILRLKSESDLKNLCNEAWAKYSDGTAESVASATTTELLVPITPRATIKLPILLCQNPEIPTFSFFLIIFEDDDNPVEDALFIFRYEIITTSDYTLCGYMSKIFQDHTDRNINRNESEIRR